MIILVWNLQQCCRIHKKMRSLSKTKYFAPNVKNEMHNVPVSPHVMKQVVLNFCSLPKVDGYRHLIAYIVCFSKWSEAKPIKGKTDLTVARILYELSCRHGSSEVQINDQGREFVKGVCTALLV